MLVLQMATKSTKRYYDSFFHSAGNTNTLNTYRSHIEVWKTSLTDTRSDGGMYLNWRQRIRDNLSATTPLNGVLWKVERTPMRGVVNQMLKLPSSSLNPYVLDVVRYRGYPWPCAVNSSASANTIGDGVAKSQATKTFFRKYNAITRGSDGLVSLGELRETLRMLRKPAKSLFDAVHRDYLDAVKRAKKRSPRSDPGRWRKALAGLWLEHAFGWAPLINDIGNAFTALEKYNSDPVYSKMITAVGKQTKEQTKPSTSGWNAPHHDLWFTGRVREYLAQKVKIRGKYVRTRTEVAALSATERMNEAFGLSLNQFVPAAWELLPWSFLVDYFTNIGDMLEQSFTDLRHLAWVQMTQVDDGIWENEMFLDVAMTKSQIDSPGWSKFVSSYESSPAKLRITRRSFNRAAGGLGVSNFQLELPGRPQQWLNMAALIATANSIHPQKLPSRM